jgi:hypothetical protein
MAVKAAQYYVGWARLLQGGWQIVDGGSGLPEDLPVLLQGPTGGQIAHGSAINAMYSVSGMSGTLPCTTVMPEFLGWPADGVTNHAKNFALAIAESHSPDPGMRVVSQSPRAGATASPHDILSVVYAKSDEKSTFAIFEGTHPDLKAVSVKTVYDKLVAEKIIHSGNSFTPWEVARTYVPETEFAAILNVFGGVGAHAKAAADYEAIWRSYMVAAHWV